MKNLQKAPDSVKILCGGGEDPYYPPARDVLFEAIDELHKALEMTYHNNHSSWVIDPGSSGCIQDMAIQISKIDLIVETIFKPMLERYYLAVDLKNN